MAIAGAVRSRAIPPFASQCAGLLAARAFSIAIDALASVALLWAPLAGVAEVASPKGGSKPAKLDDCSRGIN
jgi:hypothetical protein